MNEPINLNRVRKSRDKADAKRQADANAVKHGRTKSERLHDARLEAQTQKRLDQLKFDDE